ncbi:MAG: T9SS type A sorting domain-containing protein [Ferruginibacter sp.]
MKQFFTFLTIALAATAQAQVCTTTNGIDNCPVNTTTSITNFSNPTLFSGTALTKGAKYKFENVITIVGTPNQILDAIITIDSLSNATMTNVTSPSIDDDGASDQNGATIVGLFAPRIAPDVNLTCTNRSGFVQYTITFYPDFTGTTLPTPAVVSNLNFVHYDIDGFPVNSSAGGVNGYYKEIGYVKKLSANNPINNASTSTELTNAGTVNEINGTSWLLTYGSTTERTGVSKCSEVAYSSNFSTAQSSVTFRMGYDYKAPVPCNGASNRPTRQYGSKSGCFNLPGGGPLPVSLNNLSVAYNAGVSSVNWTTLQEFNLKSYEIYRSVDGINFAPVGNVISRNLLTKQTYQFSDQVGNVSASHIYYKLRIIDIDNSYRFSNIVSVKTNGYKTNQLIVTPNPSSSDAQIRFNAVKGGIASIVVLDAAGKTILQQQSTLMVGNNNISLNKLSALSEGMYTVKMLTNNEQYTTSLIIWR